VGFTNGSRGKIPGKTCEKRIRNNNNNIPLHDQVWCQFMSMPLYTWNDHKYPVVVLQSSEVLFLKCRWFERNVLLEVELWNIDWTPAGTLRWPMWPITSDSLLCIHAPSSAGMPYHKGTVSIAQGNYYLVQQAKLNRTAVLLWTTNRRNNRIQCLSIWRVWRPSHFTRVPMQLVWI
jgi:hypothetical protein